MPYPATPKTWVAGDILTAAQLNAELRDALLGAFPLGPPDTAWTSYTPTLVQSGAVTKTVVYAKYTKVGRTVTGAVDLSVTGTGTAVNEVAIGLPVAASVTGLVIGSGFLFDTSAVLGYAGLVDLSSSTTAIKLRSMTAIQGFLGTVSFTAALAAGDLIRFSFTYEAAT